MASAPHLRLKSSHSALISLFDRQFEVGVAAVVAVEELAAIDLVPMIKAGRTAPCPLLVVVVVVVVLVVKLEVLVVVATLLVVGIEGLVVLALMLAFATLPAFAEVVLDGVSRTMAPFLQTVPGATEPMGTAEPPEHKLHV